MILERCSRGTRPWPRGKKRIRQSRKGYLNLTVAAHNYSLAVGRDRRASCPAFKESRIPLKSLASIPSPLRSYRLIRPVPAVLLFTLTIASWAQQPATAIWHGYLRNSAGAPIVGAKVRLEGGATAEASTATDGAFMLPALPPGQYKLTVDAEGRNVAHEQAIELAPAAPVEVITLSSRGEIEVSEQQQTGATGGVALSSQAVSELPLNKRDFSSLLLLAAGTMTDTNGATNFTAQFA